MSRRDWVWIGAIIIALFIAAVGVYRVLDAKALGFAIGMVATVLGLLGLDALLKQSARKLALRVMKSRLGPPVITATLIAIAVGLWIDSCRVKTVMTWRCSVTRTVDAAPDPARCGRGEFTHMRSFVLRVQGAGDLMAAPTLHSRATQRNTASVMVDSDAGGDCVTTGVDLPFWGESQLVLTPRCSTNGEFAVNVHVCGMVTAHVDDVAELQIWEGAHEIPLHCD